MNNSMAVKPKVVLLGANGLLGTYLRSALVDYQLTVLTRSEIDITQSDQVLTVLEILQPDVIINAAAYTQVDRCETERAVAMAVNGVAPGYLAMAAKKLNAILIHYSTDYIFAGDRAAGYPEDWSEQRPVNVYGESKLAGERAITEQYTAIWQKAYIIRTAWLYGASGSNFVDTMLKLAEQRTELQVVNDQHGSPTYAFDLAAQTRMILEQQSPFGIYHCTNSGVCTWFDFAQAIFALAKIAVTVIPCASSQFPRPAPRPAYSILLNTKLPPLRSWSEALDEYLHQRSFNS